ncbi:MAG: alkaline phosphatase family protein [Fimbriimonas sp.]|nr:alkaline phosphatase family protein [Fimbriimonas sp.]
MFSAILVLALTSTTSHRFLSQSVPHLGAPAGQLPARVVPGGQTILPNGRFVTPVGDRTYTGDDLFNVVVSPDGSTTVGLSEGQIHVFRPAGHLVLKPKGWSPAAAFSPDGKSLYVSEGDEGEIAEYDTTSWKRRDKDIAVNPGSDKDAYINDLAISRDGRTLYAVDVTNEQFVVVDLVKRATIARLPAGREPYALALEGKSGRVYVANIGLFDYSVVPPLSGGLQGITRPAFAIPSKEAEQGVQFEGRQIPGLGKTGTPDAQSVWSYDVSNPANPKVIGKAISGLLIHAPADRGKAVGGSAPNALVVQNGRLYVSNANSDTVSVFDAASLKLVKTIKLAPTPLVAHLRGVIPTGLAVSVDGRRLYVCESGLESVAVIDTASGKVLGLIPAGYYPVQARLIGNDGTLVVASQFGLGYGPNGFLHPRPSTDERGSAAEAPGLIQHIDLSKLPDLATMTRQVLQNNGLTGPLRRAVHFPSQIKHVVFITKENHTFDGIFGTVPNADGEPRYSEYGDQGWISERDKTQHVPIMPNHVDLAKQFSISDNFYMEPGASGNGHRWLVGVYASIWTSRLYYAGWGFSTGKAHGRYISFGSNGSQIPEDYLENGSMWENLDRGHVSFRNYGEGFEFPGVDEDEPHSRSGAVEPINFPMPKVLFDNTCFEFPIFNTNIPDIARVDWFEDDVKKKYRDRGTELPQFINIALCNDHGSEAMPKKGYPYVCSFMADNDLAFGRLIDYLSHTPEWKSMAIFVTEDDPGGDSDHVDRSRSYVLAIGPYCKRHYVSHDHTSIMSIIRSIYDIFGLGPNNLFDALATPLDDMFTDKPDFTPYTFGPSDPRVFRPEATFDPEDPTFTKRRGMPGVTMDDPRFIKFMQSRTQGQPK